MGPIYTVALFDNTYLMHELPLTKANRLAIARAFRHHARVDVAIDCVTEGQMGRAWVDDPTDPSIFLLTQGGFFGYLAGDPESPAGKEMVAALPAPLLLMPGLLDGNDPWLAKVSAHFGERARPVERYRFSGEALTLGRLDQLLQDAPYADTAVRIDDALAGRFLAGSARWADLSDYDSAADFTARSIGYCVLDGEDVLGVAYGSLACGRGIEVSVFVQPDQRRKGMAMTLSALMLKYCLEHNMGANWDAANQESCRLATKLGYKPIGSYMAAYIKKE